MNVSSRMVCEESKGSCTRFLLAGLVAAGFAGGGLTGPAYAAEDSKVFSGEMSLEFQSDTTTKSDDPDEERTDTYATIETSLEARVSDKVAIKSLLVFEPVQDPRPGKDRFFEDQGLYAEELFGEYQDDRFGLRAGKFGQKFGIAWDAAPGVYGTDLAEDYELAEQIGVAADLHFGGPESGAHTLTFGTFFADTTVLSRSVITDRGRTRKSDGGAGNTEDFSSFSLALEGGEIPALGNLGYHLAYVRRGADAAGETDEDGLAVALTTRFTAGAVDIVPLVEYVTLQDQGGTPGTDATYLTTSLGFEMGPWNVALSRTGRDTESTGNADADDSQVQLSGGYAFENGFGIDVGWKKTDIDGIESDTLGVLLTYAVEL